MMERITKLKDRLAKQAEDVVSQQAFKTQAY